MTARVPESGFPNEYIPAPYDDADGDELGFDERPHTDALHYGAQEAWAVAATINAAIRILADELGDDLSNHPIIEAGHLLRLSSQLSTRVGNFLAHQRQLAERRGAQP
jgi:hypothetical protein